MKKLRIWILFPLIVHTVAASCSQTQIQNPPFTKIDFWNRMNGRVASKEVVHQASSIESDLEKQITNKFGMEHISLLRFFDIVLVFRAESNGYIYAEVSNPYPKNESGPEVSYTVDKKYVSKRTTKIKTVWGVPYETWYADFESAGRTT